jgi:ketosteroid isomerase-like protein
MTQVYKVSFFLLLIFISNSSFASSCDSTCKLNQVKKYFSAYDKVSRKGSSIKDVEDLLAILHDSVEYIHVEYEAKFDKKSWRDAFIRNLKRGVYQNSVENEIRILNSISGKNHIAVEYSHGLVHKNGDWKKAEPLLVLFSFRDGKISQVKELW